MIDRLILSVVVDDVFAGFFVSVPPGHVACIYDRGRGVLKKILKPGLHLKLPLWQKAKIFNIQTVEFTFKNGPESSSKKFTSDAFIITTANLEKIVVEGTVLFKLDESKIPEIWENIGEDFVPKVVEPLTRNKISAGIGKLTLDEVFSPRLAMVEREIQESLQETFKSKGIILENFLIGSVSKYESVIKR